MTVTRVHADDLPLSIQTFVHQHTCFSSLGFARLWEAIGGRPVYWLAGDIDAPDAILAGVEFGRGLLTRFQSMPDGCYGRLVCPDRRTAGETVNAELLRAVAGFGYAKLHVYDYYGSFGGVQSVDAIECHTSLVDISSPDWLPPDKTLQAEIRKAEREGVAVTPFVADTHMDAFMNLMTQTERRHGRRPRYPSEFFRRLALLARTDDRVVWNVVEHGADLAASHINLIDGDLILNWQVYFDKRFSFLKPNQVLLFSAARKAAGRGVRILNLGASPDDADTLAAYKQKWGGHDHAYRCLQRCSWLGKLT